MPKTVPTGAVFVAFDIEVEGASFFYLHLNPNIFVITFSLRSASEMYGAGTSLVNKVPVLYSTGILI
jgi:hypothetical protein